MVRLSTRSPLTAATQKTATLNRDARRSPRISMNSEDELASQTARVVQAGVRSLELIDGNSWVVFDAAPENVQVGLHEAVQQFGGNRFVGRWL